jgi:hypothetical protein
MTTIDGPGGLGGAAGPARPDDASQIAELDGDPPVDAAGAAPASDLDALAADLTAGRVSPREALDHLIDRLVEAAAGAGLDPAERAELRELFNDLIANDPHLGSLGTLGSLISRI